MLARSRTRRRAASADVAARDRSVEFDGETTELGLALLQDGVLRGQLIATSLDPGGAGDRVEDGADRLLGAARRPPRARHRQLTPHRQGGRPAGEVAQPRLGLLDLSRQRLHANLLALQLRVQSPEPWQPLGQSIQPLGISGDPGQTRARRRRACSASPATRRSMARTAPVAITATPPAISAITPRCAAAATAAVTAPASSAIVASSLAARLDRPPLAVSTSSMAASTPAAVVPASPVAAISRRSASRRPAAAASSSLRRRPAAASASWCSRAAASVRSSPSSSTERPRARSPAAISARRRRTSASCGAAASARARASSAARRVSWASAASAATRSSVSSGKARRWAVPSISAATCATSLAVASRLARCAAMAASRPSNQRRSASARRSSARWASASSERNRSSSAASERVRRRASSTCTSSWRKRVTARPSGLADRRSEPTRAIASEMAVSACAAVVSSPESARRSIASCTSPARAAGASPAPRRRPSSPTHALAQNTASSIPRWTWPGATVRPMRASLVTSPPPISCTWQVWSRCSRRRATRRRRPLASWYVNTSEYAPLVHGVQRTQSLRSVGRPGPPTSSPYSAARSARCTVDFPDSFSPSSTVRRGWKSISTSRSRPKPPISSRSSLIASRSRRR